MENNSTLKINNEETERRNKILAKLKEGKIVSVDEEGNISIFKQHEFEYIGSKNVHRCKECGKEVVIGDMRIYRAVEAETLIKALFILDKNKFQEWSPQEIEDFKILASGETDSPCKHTTLISTERVESAYNEIRYKRVCKPYGLRR